MKTGQKHLRISKDFNHDNREEWKLRDISVGNALHHINEDLRFKGISIVNRDNDSLPHLKIYEFQPSSYRNLEQYIKQIKQQFTKTIDHAVKLGKGLIREYPKLELLYNALTEGQEINLELLSKIKDSEPPKTTSEEDQNSYKQSLLRELLITEDDYDSSMFTKPIKEYNNFFNGKYIRSYEIPFNNDSYLNANGSSGWTHLSTNSINFGNKKLNTLFKTIANLPINDIPFVPNWVNPNNSNDYYKISTTYYLVNGDRESLAKNFMFLSHLIQGSMWLHNDTFHVPPNIFSVELPGFLFIRFASLFIQVKLMGNRRVLNENVMKYMYEKTKYEMFNNKLKEDTFFPDAWEIEMTFSSLVPNNFNTFMNYLQYGVGFATGNKFDNTISVGSKLTDGLPSQSEGIKDLKYSDFNKDFRIS